VLLTQRFPVKLFQLKSNGVHTTLVLRARKTPKKVNKFTAAVLTILFSRSNNLWKHCCRKDHFAKIW